MARLADLGFIFSDVPISGSEVSFVPEARARGGDTMPVGLSGVCFFMQVFPRCCDDDLDHGAVRRHCCCRPPPQCVGSDRRRSPPLCEQPCRRLSLLGRTKATSSPTSPAPTCSRSLWRSRRRNSPTRPKRYRLRHRHVRMDRFPWLRRFRTSCKCRNARRERRTKCSRTSSGTTMWRALRQLRCRLSRVHHDEGEPGRGRAVPHRRVHQAVRVCAQARASIPPTGRAARRSDASRRPGAGVGLENVLRRRPLELGWASPPPARSAPPGLSTTAPSPSQAPVQPQQLALNMRAVKISSERQRPTRRSNRPSPDVRGVRAGQGCDNWDSPRGAHEPLCQTRDETHDTYHASEGPDLRQGPGLHRARAEAACPRSAISAEVSERPSESVENHARANVVLTSASQVASRRPSALLRPPTPPPPFNPLWQQARPSPAPRVRRWPAGQQPPKRPMRKTTYVLPRPKCLARAPTPSAASVPILIHPPGRAPLLTPNSRSDDLGHTGRAFSAPSPHLPTGLGTTVAARRFRFCPLRLRRTLFRRPAHRCPIRLSRSSDFQRLSYQLCETCLASRGRPLEATASGSFQVWLSPCWTRSPPLRLSLVLRGNGAAEWRERMLWRLRRFRPRGFPHF